MNVLLETCCLSKTCASVSLLNLISLQQVNNLVCMIKGENMHAWIVQCSIQSKINTTYLEKFKRPNGNVFML